MQPVDLEAFLLAQMPVVESVVSDIARRQRVRGDELAEFRSLAYLKLVDRNYETLRRFRGTSSLRTYLTIVLHRVLLDHRNRQWGRWRPSVSARRRGALAVQIERLVTRDGLSVEEAIASMGGAVDVSDCAELLRGLKPRRSASADRVTLGEDAIPDCPNPDAGPEALAIEAELRTRTARLRGIVRAALHALDSQDHLILTLRFRDGLAVSDIARILGLEAKPLYRRIDAVLARLHRTIDESASCPEDAREMALQLWGDHVPGESGWWRPSNADSEQETVRRRGAARESLSGC